MASFVESYDRYRCVVFSVLAMLVFLTGALLFSSRPLSWGFLSSCLMLGGVSWLYFFLGRCSHLSQRVRYLVRVVPVILLMLLAGGLLLAGFILYLVHAQQPPRLVPAEGLSSEVPRLFVLSMVSLGLLLPLFAVLAVRDVVRVLRAHHRVGLRAVTFFTRSREWVVRTDDYAALVLGENVVLACRDEEELSQAVDFVNRPLRQPLLARPLDGVHYVGTSGLAKELREKGFSVSEERLATVVRFS